MQKVIVFVDYANIDRSACDQRMHIDYTHLLNEYLANQNNEGRVLKSASAYVPIDPRREHGQDTVIKALWEAGFVVKTKVGTYAGDSYKCNLDVEMAMDIMKAVYEIKPDILVLASGDVDFVPLVLELRNSGIYVEIAGFNNSTSGLLKDRANSFIDLDIYYDEYYRETDTQNTEEETDSRGSGNSDEARQGVGIQFELPGANL
jgi:uncharacterized LabA/DUF88 family protein